VILPQNRHFGVVLTGLCSLSISELNERFLMTELQVTAFGSNYAFRLIAKVLTVCPFSGGFCTTYIFAMIRLWSHPPYFRWRFEHGCQMIFTT